MNARLRRRLGAAAPENADAALAAYLGHPGRRPPLAALYGHRQVMNRHRHLVDGPACLAVLTEDAITLSHPKTGAFLIECPLGDLDGYLIDAQGRFVLHFDPGAGHSHVGSFRPVVGPTATLSARQASTLFVQQATATWQARTGRTFTNNWLMPDAAGSS